jgi:hypothetical protein
MKITNELGSYNSEVLEVTEEQYNKLVDDSKSFWFTEPSFYMWTENGVVIIPPEIASKSILLIEII